MTGLENWNNRSVCAICRNLFKKNILKGLYLFIAQVLQNFMVCMLTWSLGYSWAKFRSGNFTFTEIYALRFPRRANFNESSNFLAEELIENVRFSNIMWGGTKKSLLIDP